MEQNSKSIHELIDFKKENGVSLQLAKIPVWDHEKQECAMDKFDNFILTDGIIIRALNNRQVHWQLSGTKAENNPEAYAVRCQYDEYQKKDGKGNLMFDKEGMPMMVEDRSTIVLMKPMSELVSEKDITDFQFKVRNARATNAEMNREFKSTIESFNGDRETAEMRKAFDDAGAYETVAVVKKPNSGYCNGEVLKTGKFWVAVESGTNEQDKINFVRMIPASRLLAGAEFKDSEKSLAEKCPIGKKMHFQFTDKGKVDVSEYKPREALSERQINALVDQQKVNAAAAAEVSQTKSLAAPEKSPVTPEPETKEKEEKKPAARKSRAKAQPEADRGM